MRKLISILLLATFALPFLSALSALGETPESRLPACCRRNGAHHCMMSAEQMAQLEEGQHFTNIHSKCPLYPNGTAPVHHPSRYFKQRATLLAGIRSRAEKFLQIEAWARVALEGDQHKRGPPAVCLS